jgi:hypothetical protein
MKPPSPEQFIGIKSFQNDHRRGTMILNENQDRKHLEQTQSTADAQISSYRL